jgi:hypothetical protein
VNIFELKIWDDEGGRCTFYTVQKDGATENETDRFFLKYGQDAQWKEAAQELLSYLLYSIGDEHGAHEAFFNRYEHEVTGMPHHGKVVLDEIMYHFPHFPLRLYALKITNAVVVLFNGGIKDGPTNQTSSLERQWREACGFARRIVEALANGEVLLNKKHTAG